MKKSLEKIYISLYQGLPDIILRLPLKSQKNNYKKKFIQKISPRKKYHRKESHENILGYNTRYSSLNKHDQRGEPTH